MGYPGEFDRPDVKKAIEKYSSICEKLGKIAGFHAVVPEVKTVTAKIKENFNLIAFSLDTSFLGFSAKDKLAEIRKNCKGQSL